VFFVRLRPKGAPSNELKAPSALGQTH